MFDWIKKLFRKKKEIDSVMKYLIVGLGNMHPDYDATRHNIGFETVDYLADNFRTSFKNDTLGDVALIKHKGRQIYLLKPSTYMNRSGKAVRYWLQKLKVKDANLLVVVDDINLDFGALRFRAKGADGGHNGLKDIQEMLATNRYSRLRIGIGSDFSKGRQVDYVLGKWTKEEIKKLPEILDNASQGILSYCAIGLAETMNQFNS
jgi:PTH1 family peptidyl-tRNA hydrolase